jgi:hypothetical protein
MIGHSHLMLTIDKVHLEKATGLHVAKYTREGVNIADRKEMLKHYFSTCEKKPQIVVFSIDPWLFSGEGLSKNSWMLFLPFMDAYEIRDYIKTSVPKRIDYLRYKWVRCSRFNAVLLNASLRGYLKNWNNLKFGLIDTVRLNNKIISGDYRRIYMNQELIEDFSSVIHYLKEENVKTVLLNTPVYKSLIEVQNTDYIHVISAIDSISKAIYPETIIVDLIPRFSHNSSLFYDPIHLNPQGQKVVTEYFAGVLDSIFIKGKGASGTKAIK